VTTRIRREPPAFRTVAVRETMRLSPRLIRIGLGGPALAGFALSEPAASVRLLFPSPGANELAMPTWNGNEFLLADGNRPAIRTLTPRRFDETTLALDVEIVLHGSGIAAQWAARAQPGDTVAVSGPGRGYTVDASAPAFVLAGDETAMPAIAQLLETIPAGATIDVHIEVAEDVARIALPEHPGTTIVWHDAVAGAPPGEALVDAIRTAVIADDARVWAAGEAAAMQRIRRHLFDDRGVARGRTTIRGYWKVGRGGDTDTD
jgi:NADPH-dependent ferric siderophore reductase